MTFPPKKPKPNPLPIPRPVDYTREKVHVVDRSQIPKPKAKAASKVNALTSLVQTFKLGKAPVKHDARTLFLGEILIKPKLPPPGPFDWDDALGDDLGMMGNDVAGDCTCAGWGHAEQVQSAASGAGIPTMTTGEVLDMYKAITKDVNGRAFDPEDPSTDTGLALLDVLNWLRNNKLIGAFAKIRHNDRAEIEVAGKLFGGLYTGAMLPTDAQAQIGQIWTPTSGPGGEAGGWGGHCMYVSQGDDDGLTYVTWARRQRASYDWVNAYADEMYVLIDSAWVTGARPAPSGVDLALLQQYLKAL